MRWFLTMAAGLAAATLIVGGASAKPKVHCEVMPFSFGDDIPVDVTAGQNRILAEWTSSRMSMDLDCGAQGFIGVDVWEHANIVLDPSDPSGNTIRGRAQISIEFTSAGVVSLTGTVRGVWDDTDIVHVISARSPGGARIELRQTGVLDLDALTVDLDVNDGFFDVWPDLSIES